ncbi:MAG: D-alanyl-D-alanine carboxypeptidase/D-alanyl-D-alanine-endopeptidase [Pyrinomonadaceae bacterium]
MNTRTRIAAGVLTVTATLFALEVTRRQATLYAYTGPTNEEGTASNKTSSKNASKPSSSSADTRLANEIDNVIDSGEFASARWGVCVISLRDGHVLYSRNGDKLFTPASNMKIYTTAIAMDLLGADYRWRTSVYAQSDPDSNGTLNGDLTLYGRGAPDLVTHLKENKPSLAQLADQLYARGVRRVRGDLVGDESYFRGNSFGDGWQWNDVQWYFGAEASALSIDANEVDLNIVPAGSAGELAAVTLNKDSNYFHVSNNVASGPRDVIPTVGIRRGLSDNEFVVWGEFPAGGKGFGARLSVHNPALWAATLFKDVLAARGIIVEGQVRHRDFRVRESERFNPQKAVELAAVTSNTLGEIAAVTNKNSVNLNAELILRSLGRERTAMAPDADDHKMRERGDDEAGLAIIRMWLQRAGIPSLNLALHDGSGLSRLNLITPEATARLLVNISKSSAASSFRFSLPVAGEDGTLAFRMKAVAGRIAAKTGSLVYDNALSGYATTEDGEELAFAVICNDSTGAGNSVVAIDRIGLAIAGHPALNHQIPSQK